MYYDLNKNGWVLVNSRENLYISDLKGLIDVYMLQHMFTNWRKVPTAEKAVLQSILQERYIKCEYFLFFCIKILVYTRYELFFLCMV